jgi:hypothetical protein
MKIKNVSLIVLLAVVLSTNNVKAQFSLTGEMRPRTELSHGNQELAGQNQDASLFTTQRTRINTLYTNEYLNTKIVLQDVRLWGGQPQLVKNEDFAVSVHEAWAEIDLNKSFSLKAGRQELVYDDHRIFGNVGWAQQARTHDLALFKYKSDWEVHLGLAFNHIDSPDMKGDYKSLQFVWANHLWDSSSLSILFLNNGVPNPTNILDARYSQTIGGRFTTQLDDIGIASNLYLQTGKDGANNDLRAYNFLFEASGKLKDTWKWVGGIEILSGTDYDELDDNKSFTPLYGTNHKFNGFMDYFFVGEDLNEQGLIDLYAKVGYPIRDFTLNGHMHYFATAASIDPNTDDYLGTEIDLGVNWKFKPEVQFDMGFSSLFASESMELLKGGDNSVFQYWGYLMITVKPTFIGK